MGPININSFMLSNGSNARHSIMERNLTSYRNSALSNHRFYQDVYGKCEACGPCWNAWTYQAHRFCRGKFSIYTDHAVSHLALEGKHGRGLKALEGAEAVPNRPTNVRLKDIYAVLKQQMNVKNASLYSLGSQNAQTAIGSRPYSQRKIIAL